jgi:hypothetical protein
MIFAGFLQNSVINSEGNMAKTQPLQISEDGSRMALLQSCVPHAKVKPNIVLVDGAEEKHVEGAYFTLSDNQWIALGD